MIRSDQTLGTSRRGLFCLLGAATAALAAKALGWLPKPTERWIQGDMPNRNRTIAYFDEVGDYRGRVFYCNHSENLVWSDGTKERGA